MKRHVACLLGLLLLPWSTRSHAQDKPRIADEHILLETTRGDIVLALYPDVAPRQVAQLLRLTRLGVYDTTWFHRVERSFVLQITNAQNRLAPLTPEQLQALERLPLETSSGVLHHRGVISMAHEDGDVNSGETSFSILLVDAPHLDGKYTVFGEVEQGWPVVEAIRGVTVDAKNEPLERVAVMRATVKTAAEVAHLVSSGQLQASRPETPRAVTAPAPKTGWATVGAIAFMMLCGLLVHLGAGRVSPKVLGAVGLLCVLIGGYSLFTTLGVQGRAGPGVATAVFFGLLALFKLMNRFESSNASGTKKS